MSGDEGKLLLFKDKMMVSVDNPILYTKKLVEPIIEFFNVLQY